MHQQVFFCTFNLILLWIVATLADNDLLPKPGECGQVQPEQHSNRKHIPQPGEFPWMGLVSLKDSTDRLKPICHAVLISQRHLITVSSFLISEATHVILGYSTTLCREGGDNCSTKVFLDIEEIIMNPYFKRNEFHNDIGLLRLKTTVTYSEYIRPICLPNIVEAHKEFGGAQLMSTGWTNNRIAVEQQKKFVMVYNEQDCQRTYEELNRKISENQLCVFICDNDMPFITGSALMDFKRENNGTSAYYNLVGILSVMPRGSVFPRPPTIFTRIDRYLSWINENVY